MGGGGHHAKPPEVPDWRIYKVENVPELMKTKKALSAHGLSDPWLRNEVWRYEQKNYSLVKTLYIMGKRGFKYGLVLALVTTAIGKAMEEPSSAHH